MNLIFIYGPPAVGKTTVGRELAALTGYRFFYNHLTVPAAKAIFPTSQQPHPDERYAQLLRKLRIDALDAAAKADLDVIFTVAYAGVDDNDFVAEVVELFASRGGDTHFIQLKAPDNVLLERVENADRAALHMGKVTSASHLHEVLQVHDMHASVPYQDVLQLDTEHLAPAETARRIADNFRLTSA